MMMQFKEYATNKFMSMNAPIELDIVVKEGEQYPFILQSAFDTYSFVTWDEAVKFAEHKYGVRNVFQTEDEYYDELFLQDSDGYATLGGQV